MTYPHSVQVYRLPTGGGVEEATFTFTSSQDELEQIQSAVGGYFEPLGIANSALLLFNEDGKRLGLPLNTMATALARQAGALPDDDSIVGEVLLVGYSDDGEITDAPRPDQT